MKTNRAILAGAGIMIMAVIAIMFSACEKDENTSTVDDFFNDVPYTSLDRDRENPEELSLSPSSPSVTKVGEQVAFTVRGGSKPFHWSVSDTSVGTISPATTQTDVEQAVYKCLKLTKNTVVVTDGLGRAAVVDVAASVPNLVVSPSAISFLATDMGVAQSYTFSSTGGLTPITWSSDTPSLGAVTAGGGVWTSIGGAYTAAQLTNTTVKVYATDSEGSTAYATISFE